MKADLLKGHLDLLLLAVLADSPAHGYLVIDRLRRASGGSFDQPKSISGGWPTRHSSTHMAAST